MRNIQYRSFICITFFYFFQLDICLLCFFPLLLLPSTGFEYITWVVTLCLGGNYNDISMPLFIDFTAFPVVVLIIKVVSRFIKGHITVIIILFITTIIIFIVAYFIRCWGACSWVPSFFFFRLPFKSIWCKWRKCELTTDVQTTGGMEKGVMVWNIFDVGLRKRKKKTDSYEKKKREKKQAPKRNKVKTKVEINKAVRSEKNNNNK